MRQCILVAFAMFTTSGCGDTSLSKSAIACGEGTRLVDGECLPSADGDSPDPDTGSGDSGDPRDSGTPPDTGGGEDTGDTGGATDPITDADGDGFTADDRRLR